MYIFCFLWRTWRLRGPESSGLTRSTQSRLFVACFSIKKPNLHMYVIKQHKHPTKRKEAVCCQHSNKKYTNTNIRTNWNQAGGKPALQSHSSTESTDVPTPKSTPSRFWSWKLTLNYKLSIIHAEQRQEEDLSEEGQAGYGQAGPGGGDSGWSRQRQRLAWPAWWWWGIQVILVMRQKW